LLFTCAVFVAQRSLWPGVPLGNLYFLPILVISYFWGLGLAVSRNIVQQHGGTLELVERDGVTGAVFRIRLPVGPSA
jgi:nitrogen-specific signal transduction histidine kinase